LDLAARGSAARTLGGDFYDFSRYPGKPSVQQFQQGERNAQEYYLW
jgi:hypothetical protein